MGFMGRTALQTLLQPGQGCKTPGETCCGQFLLKDDVPVMIVGRKQLRKADGASLVPSM